MFNKNELGYSVSFAYHTKLLSNNSFFMSHVFLNSVALFDNVTTISRVIVGECWQGGVGVKVRGV